MKVTKYFPNSFKSFKKIVEPKKLRVDIKIFLENFTDLCSGRVKLVMYDIYMYSCPILLTEIVNDLL